MRTDLKNKTRRRQMTEIGQLSVIFERDWKPRHYPYLGQTCLLGGDRALLEGFDCKKPVEFSPHYGSPAAQLNMGNVFQGDNDAVERFVQLVATPPAPFWVLPAEGWRTARCLQAAIQGQGAINAGVVDIIGPLSAEIDNWLAIMEAAVDADIRFHVEMAPCPNPPEDLVLFLQRDFDEVANLIREALEEAGIEIKTEEANDA